MKNLLDHISSEVLPEEGYTEVDTHKFNAPSAKNRGSQKRIDALFTCAPSTNIDGEGGHKNNDSQATLAPSLLNIYVQTYEQSQKMRMETMNRIRCWLRDTKPKEEWPCQDPDKVFNDAYIKSLPVGEIPNDLRLTIAHIEELEKESAKWIKRELKNHPLWPWLSGIKGIGPVLAGRLLHRIGDIRRFPNVANLWSYCGLDGLGWRKRPHNWALTSICFNIAESFQKQKMFSGGYRDIYDARKEYETTKPPCTAEQYPPLKKDKKGNPIYRDCLSRGFTECCRPAHINNKARRYAVKEFLKDLWIEGNK